MVRAIAVEIALGSLANLDDPLLASGLWKIPFIKQKFKFLTHSAKRFFGDFMGELKNQIFVPAIEAKFP